MSIFCGIAIVFVTLLPPIECLLNQGAISGGHEDKLVTELIQNVTRLNQAMDAASAREQANMADLIKANIQLQQNFTRLQQTIADDKQRIEYIEKERADHNRTNTCEQQRLIELESAEINNNKTITELRQRIYELEKETVEQNRTITIQQQRIDELENAAVNYTKTSINQGQKIDELEIKILDHNKTNTVQQQRIDELKDANINYNKTLLGQQQKMNEIENVNFGLHQTLSCINRTFVMYQTKIDSRMNQSFGAYQVILHDIVDKHNQHVSVFNNQSIALNQSVADLGKQFHYLSLSLLDTEKKYAAINASLTEKTTDIAFTVSLTQGSSQWANKNILYDKMITNVGKGYSKQTGIFTCPKGGLYVFTWSTLSGNDNEDCYAYIYRNGEKLLMTNLDEAGGSAYEAASYTAVFHLSVGDQVWIQTDTCGYFYGYPYTAFSGWKL